VCAHFIVYAADTYSVMLIMSHASCGIIIYRAVLMRMCGFSLPPPGDRGAY